MVSDNPRIPRYSIQLVKEKTINIEDYSQVSTSGAAARVARVVMGEPDREHLFIVTLDSKNKVIGINEVSVGSLSTSIAHPREVMKMAVLQNAAAIIIVHNHPSGDPAPSRQDREMTLRIKKSSEILGIALLDHVVLGDPDLGYSDFSFADSGMLGSL